MKSRSDELKLGKLSTTLCSMLAAGPALAQGSAGTPPPGEESHLAPITVKGETDNGFKTDHSASMKFTAPLVDTPKSVTVIPQELIQSTGAATLTEALRTVPGITFGAGEGGNPLGDRPFIRGYDAQGSTFVDGLRDIGATSREVFNTESIEVTKGSDGAYGGRGGAGGSINLISKTPHLGNTAEGSAGVGTDRYRRFTADGNWQFADHAAFRLNVMSHNNDAPGRDAVKNERWGIAPSLSFGLGTPTRVSASYYYLSTDDLPDGGIPYLYGFNNQPANVDTVYPAKVNRHNFYGLIDRDFRKTTSGIGTLRVEHDINSHLTLRNTTRYTKSSQDYIWTQPDDSQGNVAKGMVWRRANTRASDVWTVANQTELFGEFHTGFLKHSFTTGLEVSSERSANDSYTVAAANGAICKTKGIGVASGYNCTSLWSPNPNDPWAGSTHQRNDPTRQRTVTKSLYAFDTIEFTKRWQANVGLRIDDYSTNFRNTAASGGKSIPRDDTLFNYQFGLVYKPAQNGSVYASIASSSTPAGSLLGQGSESQSLTPGRSVGANAAQLAPEKNRSYEIGTKWDVLQNQVSLTGALFQIDTTNARITLPNNEYAMAGNKRVQGLELGIAGRLTKQWQVFGGYTYMKSELRDNGKTTSDNGHQFPSTPKNSISLWTSYDVLPKLTIGGGSFYMSQVYGDTANQRAVPSYWRFDAMATYRINKKTDLKLNVQNLFNRTYYDHAYPAHYASIAPERSAFVTLNARY